MTNTIELHGRTIDREDLPAVLSLALAGNPPVPRYDWSGDSASYLVDLVTAVEDHPFHPIVAAELELQLRTAVGQQLTLLGRVAHQISGIFSVPTLEAALRRSLQEGNDDTTFSLGAALSRELLQERGSYDPALRDLAGNPPLRGVLNGCFVRFDHVWFITQAHALLGDDPGSLIEGLASAAAMLTRGELQALRDELTDTARGFSAEAHAAIRTYFDEISDRPIFAKRGDAIRW